MSVRPTLAIVVPCFNEEEVLPETALRLAMLLDQLVRDGRAAPDSYACFVDDGSQDNTWAIIEDLQERSGRFNGIKLSRNRGHQNALLAGLLGVTGDIVISVDADLQDDLNAINGMLKAASDGADIVYGVRSARTSDTFIKRGTARMYYRLLGRLGVEVVFDHADFRLMTRQVIEELRRYGESNLFLRALIPQLGFRTSIVTYERSERFAGTSKYPLHRMLALALEGVTSFSIRPLRVVTALGVVTSVFAVLLTIWALVVTVVMQATVPGWASV
ncbi:MAG: glycosyltransferase family 2 protein, partial [Pseudoxanthomonas sp.]